MSRNPSGAIHPTVFMALWGILSFGLQVLRPLDLPESAVAQWSGWVAIVLGGVLMVWAQLAFRGHGTTTDHSNPTTALITDGPFRISRNPIYVALVLIFAGLSALYGVGWGLIMTGLFALAVARFTIRPEEDYLEKQFGQEYVDYKARVRRWL